MPILKGTQQDMQQRDFEREAFHAKLREDHGRVNPCFMTGKGCVYRETIDASRSTDAGRPVDGFMAMPFRSNLSVFFDNCLTPFFETNYSPVKKTQSPALTLRSAAQVSRPGIIVCEGICKRIQEADFLVADVSLPNANVFYELGLAYGIGQKIALVCHDPIKGTPWGNFLTQTFDPTGSFIFFYDNLNPIVVQRTATDPINLREYRVSDRIWQMTEPQLSPGLQDSPRILVYEHLIEDFREDPIAARSSRFINAPGVADSIHTHSQSSGRHKGSRTSSAIPSDISLDFVAHVKSAVGVCLAKIIHAIRSHESRYGLTLSHLSVIDKLRNPVDYRFVGNESRGEKFDALKHAIDTGYCLIIRTGKNCHSMSYFWLGYAHARGKNVVPITVQNRPGETIDDLAFDIRAQRHMVFTHGEAERLRPQLDGFLEQMVHMDFSRWYRKRFWDKMLGQRNEVSIFTGALHHKEHSREMIGDWDLRAAAELTAYFGLHQYRARIETPIYTPEAVRARGAQGGEELYRNYYEQVTSLLRNKSCIIIASPEVNALTEIILGRVFGVQDSQLFRSHLEIATDIPLALVGFKEKSGQAGEEAVERVFYQETYVGDSKVLRRGFISGDLHDRHHLLLDEFLSQSDDPRVDPFTVYGHLLIVPNPFDDRQSDKDRHFIILLNGLSGPATFALTHALTGGVNMDFVDYGRFDPVAEAEGLLPHLLDRLTEKEEYGGVDCVVQVKVGFPEQAPTGGVRTSDWRRVKSWALARDIYGPGKYQNGVRRLEKSARQGTS